MTLADHLVGARLIFLETAPVIYFVEGNPAYMQLVAPVFDRIDSGALQAVTSPVTLAECLVHPFRAGNKDAVRAFSDLIVNGANTTFRKIYEQISLLAAELRARHNFTLGDAFPVGTALAAECDALLTNDPVLKRITGLDVIVSDDVAGAR